MRVLVEPVEQSSVREEEKIVASLMLAVLIGAELPLLLSES